MTINGNHFTRGANYQELEREIPVSIKLTRIESAKAKVTKAWNSVKGFFKAIGDKLADAGRAIKNFAERTVNFLKEHKREVLIVTGIALTIIGVAVTPIAPPLGVKLAIVGAVMTTFNAVKLQQEKKAWDFNSF